MSIALWQDGVTDINAETVNPIIQAVNGATNIGAGIYNALDYNAVGDGVADDTAGIAETAVAAAAGVTDNARVAVQLAGGQAFALGRRVPGSQTSGGVCLDLGVSLDGRGATLLLAENCAFITNHWPINEGDNESTPDLQTTIATDVAVSDTQFEVDSTVGFVAGYPVIVRLNDNEWDGAEVKDWFWAIVESVDDATHMTLDRASPAACDVSDTNTSNKAIIRAYQAGGGGFIRDLTLIDPRTGSANAEAGVDLRYVRNLTVENIVAEHPGAGAVMLAYPESVTVRNVRVTRSEKQEGQASKGRAITIWNAKNVLVESLYAEQFEGAAIVCESYCRAVVFDGVHLVNNFPGRDALAFIAVNQGSDVLFRNVIIEGAGGCALFDEGGTSGNTIAFQNLWINTSTPLTSIPLATISGSLRIGDTVYGELVRRTVPFRLFPSIAGQYDLPTGLYRRVRMFVTSTTGLTEIYLLNSNGDALLTKSLLANNQLVDIPLAGFAGTSSAFNGFNGKSFAIYGDGTVPADAYGFIEVEYWPTLVNDKSSGRAMLPVVNPPAYTVSNLSADRTFDADSTNTAELADVLGTLIQDLKQSGWIA